VVLGSAVQEWRQILDAPGIVDDQEAASIIKRVRQCDFGRVNGAKAWARAGDGLGQICDAANEIVRLLAQRDA
jgi:hypothetical protein